MRFLDDKLSDEKKYSQQDIFNWLRNHFATGLSCDTFSDDTPWGPIENKRIYIAAILIDESTGGIDSYIEKKERDDLKKKKKK
jgi:hypothetical protein